MHIRWIGTVSLVAFAICGLASADAGPKAESYREIFHDSFDVAASKQWGNERGKWEIAGAAYKASQPSNSPLTYSSLPYVVGDLNMDVDINKVGDGGLWIHADAAGKNGVLLVTGGEGWGVNGRKPSGMSLYFQVVKDGNPGPIQGKVENIFPKPGEQTTHVHVEVRSDRYTATAEGKTAAISCKDFSTGRVGLYDFSAQTFDNFSLAIPDTGEKAVDIVTKDAAASKDAVQPAENSVQPADDADLQYQLEFERSMSESPNPK